MSENSSAGKLRLEPLDGDHQWANEKETREAYECEAYEEQMWSEEMERWLQERADEERFAWEAAYDPTSDAYYSSGAREMRIDAGL